MEELNEDWLIFHLEEAGKVLASLRDRVSTGTLDTHRDQDIAAHLSEALGHINAAWRGRLDATLDISTLDALSDVEFRILRAPVKELDPT